MASVSEEVRLVIKAEVDKAVTDLNKFNASLGKTEAASKSAVQTFASWAKGALSIAAVGAALKYIVDETVQSQKVLAQLDAVLKSTNNAVGMTKDEIVNLAQEMSNLSAIDDDVIIGGQNLLLTFTNIGRDVFPEATQAMLDMSVALGQDVSNSAIQLGKALNEPIQGVTALRRVGVQLSEQQEQQIKQFLAVNDLASAQKIILGELAKEFGGSASAYANTLGGALDRMKNVLGDIAKVIGNAATPGLRLFGETLQKLSQGGNPFERIAASLGSIGGDFFVDISIGLADFNVSAAQAAYGLEYLKNGFDETAPAVKKANDELEKAKQILNDTKWKGGRTKVFEKGNTTVEIGAGQFGGYDEDRLAELSGQGFVEKKYSPATTAGGGGGGGGASGGGGGMRGSAELQKEMEKQQEAYLQYMGEFEQLALVKENDRYSKMMEYAKAHKLNLEELEKEHESNMDAIRQEAIQKETQDFQQKAGAILSFAQNSVQQLQQVFAMQSQNELAREDGNYKKKKAFIDFFIKDEEKKNKAMQILDLQHEMAKKQIQRREFERSKQMQIASATISMLTGAMQAFQSMLVIPIVGIILGAVAAAAVLAFGAAQIAMIAQTQPPALAEGGLIMGSSSGQMIRAGEGGKSEAIIPLENPEAQSKLGGLGTVNNYYNFDGAVFASQDVPRDLIEAIDRGMYKLQREKQSMFARAL